MHINATEAQEKFNVNIHFANSYCFTLIANRMKSVSNYELPISNHDR